MSGCEQDRYAFHNDMLVLCADGAKTQGKTCKLAQTALFFGSFCVAQSIVQSFFLSREFEIKLNSKKPVYYILATYEGV